MSQAIQRKWWKEEVIYQIYPRSYKDSTGDGIGDIQGIISKLDYIKELGIDIIWLSPVYQSPNDDNGYDISDYYDIHPEFGTMADFDQLLNGVHDRGMRLIMDVVFNHSSDEHEWFEKSKQSTDNDYRDYYIWKKGVNGGPPNNWRSFFGGSAWEYDNTTDEYFLHLFTKKQPDLNWENPKVVKEVHDITRFWLDKGIDGFRMDVIPLISKRLDFADTDLEAFNDIVTHVYSNGPKVHEYINDMCEKVLKHYDIMTVGEGPGITKDTGLDYVGHDRGELSMIFHLDHMFLGHGPLGKFDPVPYGWPEVKQIFQDWYDAMGDSGWISIFLDNHDFPRMVSRFGNDTIYREQSAKMLAILIMTMRGTPCIYQGTELGMTNVQFDNISDYRDVETHNYHKEFISRGVSDADFLSRVHEHGRDNARTPIQWNSDINAGFSAGKPWIIANPNYKTIHAQECLDNKDSIFYFYKNLMDLRKQEKTLVYGEWQVIEQESQDLYVYRRWDDCDSFYILLNHSDHHHIYNLDLSEHNLILSNNSEHTDILIPWEGRIYKRIN